MRCLGSLDTPTNQLEWHINYFLVGATPMKTVAYQRD